jgi:chemotaxis protein MotA
MFPLIGIIVVLTSVVGGFMMEHGNPRVLIQPAELLIIGGAAAGAVLIANPTHLLKGILGRIKVVFTGSKFTRKVYLASLKNIYAIMQKARKGGLSALENDVEDPKSSELLAKFPPGAPDHHIRAFVCDTLRMAITGGPSPFEIDQMMEVDMEVHHQYSHQPAHALTTVADSLPGMGIVAAVLGVVITMGALGGPPEEIGHKVAAALVGTFLGILMCYGLISPMASRMARAAEDEGQYYHVLRVAISAFLKGSSPLVAVEFGRRAVPGHVRPTFQEMETACRGEAAAK